MRFYSCLAAVLLVPGFAVAVEPAPKSSDSGETLRKGLAYLEKEGTIWKNERKCAACHHVPMMVWAQNEARARGLKVNESVWKEAMDFLLAGDNRAKILPDPKDKRVEAQGLAMASLMTVLAVSGRPPADAPGRDVLSKMMAHIVEKQDKDGAWLPPNGRPPVFDTKEVATILASLALAADAKTAAAARDKAQKWLATQPANEHHQALVLRLVLEKQLGQPPAKIQNAIQKMRALQKPDGGWSQTKEMASDAFATGQTLYALNLAGVASTDPAIQKARAFLVKTQNIHGFWPMTSRPAKPGDKPARNLDPITFAGSTWAMLGLLKTTP